MYQTTSSTSPIATTWLGFRNVVTAYRGLQSRLLKADVGDPLDLVKCGPVCRGIGGMPYQSEVVLAGGLLCFPSDFAGVQQCHLQQVGCSRKRGIKRLRNLGRDFETQIRG